MAFSILEAEAPVPDHIVQVEEIVLTVPEKIVFKATEYGLDPEKALRVARCESNFNPLAKNPHSTASGVFQFIRGTWASVNRMRGITVDVFDEDANIDNAMWLARKEGWHHWQCK